MTYEATDEFGNSISLPMPSKAEFDSAEDMPADSFCGVFPLTHGCGALTYLKICGENGGMLFYGTVDIQHETVSGGGSTLNLKCRSLAGLLLDSEPLPSVCDSPSLPEIFSQHLKPYGFTGFSGSSAIFSGQFCITKGMSEWQAAALFCSAFLNAEPRVHGTIFDASGNKGNGSILFDNCKGTGYFSAERLDRCCDRITEIYAPDGAAGCYRLAAQDGEAARMGILRKRCLAPSPQNDQAAIKNSIKKSFVLHVCCPECPKAGIGDAAALNDPVLGCFGNLEIAGVHCTAGADGIRTRYSLRRK